MLFIPMYGVAHEGQLFPAVSSLASRFRRTMAMDTVRPALILASHCWAVKILPLLSFVIWYFPALTQALPAERLKVNFRKSSNP